MCESADTPSPCRRDSRTITFPRSRLSSMKATSSNLPAQSRGTQISSPGR